MDTSATLIILAGVGAAAFLWWKSQQDQAAALAAAQAAPGPGLFGKFENNFKAAAHALPGTVKAVVRTPLNIESSITSHIATYAGDAAGFVKGLF